MIRHRPQLIHLRARPATLYLSRGRTVLATDTQGFVREGAGHGLFVHETRMLSRHVLLVNGRTPYATALSNVEQYSWLGYYILPVPELDIQRDANDNPLPPGSQHVIEVRVSRVVGEGLHEDLDITNFSQQRTRFTLDLEVASDFADLIETTGERQQHGILDGTWRELTGPAWELEFTYHVEHHYAQQDETGFVRLQRGVIIRIEQAGSLPERTDRGVRFGVELTPHGQWHACLIMVPRIDDVLLDPPRGCRRLRDMRTVGDASLFLAESTKFEGPWTDTLSPVVTGALEQAVYDPDALHLPDLDHGRRS